MKQFKIDMHSSCIYIKYILIMEERERERERENSNKEREKEGYCMYYNYDNHISILLIDPVS